MLGGHSNLKQGLTTCFRISSRTSASKYWFRSAPKKLPSRVILRALALKALFLGRSNVMRFSKVSKFCWVSITGRISIIPTSCGLVSSKRHWNWSAFGPLVSAATVESVKNWHSSCLGFECSYLRWRTLKSSGLTRSAHSPRNFPLFTQSAKF